MNALEKLNADAEIHQKIFNEEENMKDFIKLLGDSFAEELLITYRINFL